MVCSRERLDTQALRVGSGAGSAAGWGPRPALPSACLCSALARGPVSTLPFVGFGQSQEFTALPKGQPGLKFSSKHGADS